MRISTTNPWLAIALALGTRGVKGSPPDPAIEFNSQDFMGNGDNPNYAIFVQPTFNEPRNFSWTNIAPDIQIESVSLYALGDDSPIATGPVESGTKFESPGGSDENPHSIGQPSVPASTATQRQEKTKPLPTSGLTSGLTSGSEKRQDQKPEAGSANSDLLEVRTTDTGGVVRIMNMHLLASSFSRKALYFGASGGGGVGIKYSRAFTVVPSNGDYLALVRDPNSVFLDQNPVTPRPATTSANAPNGMLPLPTRTAESDPAKEAPRTSLPTGAVIGIAVACGVIGLALIGAAIWFFCLRRKPTNKLNGPGGPYGTERRHTEDLIAEKEASAGVGDPSPHSPYSDEAIVLSQSNNVGAAAAAPIFAQQHQQHQQQVIPGRIAPQPQPHDQPRSYTPYSDRGSGIGVPVPGAAIGSSPSMHAPSLAHSEDTTSRAGMGSPTAGRVTPHNSVAPQYAHLVEEGMTEDEIRRLEDEERQLDAEIERAGRR